MNNPSESLLPSSSIGLRLLRGLALLGLALGFALVGGLLLLPLFPSLCTLFWSILNNELFSRDADAGIVVELTLIVLIPLALGYTARRLRPLSFRHWIILSLLAATLLVLNLLLLALFPSVQEALGALLSQSFWKVSGALLLLFILTLVVAGLAGGRLRLRSMRGLVQFGLTIAFILTMDLVAVALFPSWFGRLEDLPKPFFFLGNSDSETLASLALAHALILVTPLVIFLIAWRQRLRSWWWIGGGYLALAPVFAYLATDDAVIRHPISMDEIAPAFPDAEKSFAVLMRYGKHHPLGRDFRAPQRIFEKITTGESVDPGKPAEWLAWLKTHRHEIEVDWADLAPVRAWWNELNTFDRIGDLTPSRYDAEILTFAAPRTMAQHTCAVASLQALDGHGDEAVETLLPLLQVGRKLQTSARTLVREMIAIVMERMSIETAEFVLDHASVSPASRARLSAALSASGGGVAGARRLMAMEYAFRLDATLNRPLGDILAGESYAEKKWTNLRLTMNALSPFVYNPRATYNLYGDFVADEQEIVANRQLDQLNPRGKKFFSQEARPRFKNFIGTIILGGIIPAYNKVFESYWNTQDRRAALLARVTQN